MNLLSKPIVIYSIFSILIGAVFSLGLSLFLPNSELIFQDKNLENKETKYKIAEAYNLDQKQIVKKITKKVVKKNSGEFLLKDFSISGIFLSAEENTVLIRDTKGGIFLNQNNAHKNYKLIEVFEKKAKFKKGINFYWAFLNPKDEQQFSSNEMNSYEVSSNTTQTSVTKSVARKSVARDMFEDIIYKDGKYFIPKSKLEEFTSLDRIFSSIAIQAHNISNKISFKINYLTSNSIFYKLGLRKRDFIIKTNNENFKSVTEPIKYFQNMKNLKQLSLTIKRNGQIKELKYEIY